MGQPVRTPTRRNTHSEVETRMVRELRAMRQRFRYMQVTHTNDEGVPYCPICNGLGFTCLCGWYQWHMEKVHDELMEEIECMYPSDVPKETSVEGTEAGSIN